MHEATLGINQRRVAVKIQYPFLRTQSKWDLFSLDSIVSICTKLMKYSGYEEVDLLKIFHTWTETLAEELDFEREIANAEATRNLFKGHKHLVIP